jgi:hypothetical protein
MLNKDSMELEYRELTQEEQSILKERLKLILRVNITIGVLAVVWFFSVFFTMKNFGSNLWLLLAILPSVILLSGIVFLYFAGSKIRKDYKTNRMCILKAPLTKLYFKKRGMKARYYVEFGDENKFEIDENAFNKLNGHINNKFAIHYSENSRLVFRLERYE